MLTATILKNKTYAALLACSTVWCLSIVAAPRFGLQPVYSFFSRICHQDPARSWHIAGEPFAVCIRCTAIYFAFAAALWLGIRGSVRWLRFSLLLIVCEFIFARLVVDDAVLRAMSGILVGACSAPFVRQAIEELRDAM
jgi:uncharacterized membrane protein